MRYMYSNKNVLYIVSAISAIEKINIYANSFSAPATFLEANNQMNFNATVTLLVAIAEETKKIDKELLQTQPGIKWQNIADMRNILAHDYRGIDPEIVFDVVTKELPELKSAFLQMLKHLPQEFLKEILQTKQYGHLQKIIFVTQ